MKAFLDIEKNGHSFGRIYKITKDQYDEVKQKEIPDYPRIVDLGEADGGSRLYLLPTVKTLSH